MCGRVGGTNIVPPGDLVGGGVGPDVAPGLEEEEERRRKDGGGGRNKEKKEDEEEEEEEEGTNSK